jgi:copper chaperone
MTTELKVEGMSCGACVGHVTRALQSVDDVERALVDLETGKATVEHSGADISQLVAAVEEEGYTAQPSPSS